MIVINSFLTLASMQNPLFFLANNKSERINNESLFQMIGMQDIVRSSEFTG